MILKTINIYQDRRRQVRMTRKEKLLGKTGDELAAKEGLVIVERYETLLRSWSAERQALLGSVWPILAQSKQALRILGDRN
jgi:hypothetical protein